MNVSGINASNPASSGDFSKLVIKETVNATNTEVGASNDAIAASPQSASVNISKEARDALAAESGGKLHGSSSAAGASETQDSQEAKSPLEQLIKALKEKVKELREELKQLASDKSEKGEEKRQALKGQIAQLTGQINAMTEKMNEQAKKSQQQA